MNEVSREFISEENREYKFKLGHLIASSLSGFIAGSIVSSVIWMLAFHYYINIL